MKNEFYEKARQFIYRNARPLELARWRYAFENGSKEDVLTALGAYQNADGGFGHAIEPDSFNENSSPVSTLTAANILYKIGFCDGAHPIVRGILSYLDSGKDFGDGKWFNTIKTNNDYPHAIWWEWQGAETPDDNPTVALAGFALAYADRNSALYKKAADIACRAVTEFIKAPTDEFHTLRCYLNLYNFYIASGARLFDIDAFRTALFGAIDGTVCKDEHKWFTEYVCKPSVFFDGTEKLFDIVGKALCEREADMILKAQQADGAFPVTWLWHNDYKEFTLAANWWKSSIIIDNMLYLKALGKIR